MTPCYVCGGSFAETIQECPDCQTPAVLLHTFSKRAGNKRFFFGSSKPPETSADEHEPSAATAPSRQPSVKQNLAHESIVDPEDLPEHTPSHEDLFALPAETSTSPGLAESDIGLTGAASHYARPSEKQVVKNLGQPNRMFVHLLDVALCLLLNLLVLGLVMWKTQASLSHLMGYSLLPLLFVFLSFTILYYWLFTTLFKRSLGHLLLLGTKSRGAS